MKRKQGFTLAELLIVVAIIAVLVAIAIPVFGGQVEKSKQAVDMANMRAAYAVLLADYLSGDAEAGKTYYFDINSSSIVTSKPSNGYGKSRTEIEGWSLENTTVKGIPNPNGDSPAVLSLMIGANDSVAFQWGGGITLWSSLSSTTLNTTNKGEEDWWSDTIRQDKLTNLQTMISQNDNATRKKADQQILTSIADYFNGKSAKEVADILGYNAEKNSGRYASAQKGSSMLFQYSIDSGGSINLTNFDTANQPFLSEIGYSGRIWNRTTGKDGALNTGWNGNNYANQYLFTSDEMVGSVTDTNGTLSKSQTTNGIYISFKVDGTGEDATIKDTRVWVSGLGNDYDTAKIGK